MKRRQSQQNQQTMLLNLVWVALITFGWSQKHIENASCDAQMQWTFCIPSQFFGIIFIRNALPLWLESGYQIHWHCGCQCILSVLVVDDSQHSSYMQKPKTHHFIKYDTITVFPFVYHICILFVWRSNDAEFLSHFIVYTRVYLSKCRQPPPRAHPLNQTTIHNDSFAQPKN